MNSSTEMTQAESSGEGMDLFGRYLSVWVALAIMPAWRSASWRR